MKITSLLPAMLFVMPMGAGAAPGISGQFNLNGAVTATESSITWMNNAGVANQATIGSTGLTGSFTGLGGSSVTIQNLTRASEPVGSAFPPQLFISFNAAPALPALNVSSIPLGVFGSAQCGLAPAPGQTCTPVTPGGSPFSFLNTPTGSSATWTASGATSDGLSLWTAIFTAQFTAPFQTVLSDFNTNGSISNAFSAAVDVVVTPVNGPGCPGGLATLIGTWNFSTNGFDTRFTILGSAGRFTASAGVDRNGNPIGILSITQTTAMDGTVTRLETDAGGYQVNSDCTGTLTFNTSSRPVQFDFYLVNGTEMVIIGTNNGDVIHGTARLAIPVACPTPPIGALAGTWIFSVEDWLLNSNPQGFFTAAGRFVAATNGSLVVTGSAGAKSGNVRMEMSYGRGDVDASCTGGHLSFAIGGHPVQFDYFFTSPDRILLSGATDGEILIGEARRYGTTD